MLLPLSPPQLLLTPPSLNKPMPFGLALPIPSFPNASRVNGLLITYFMDKILEFMNLMWG